MAATSEISPGPSGEQLDDGADGKLEKKRKFKPFEAMRKFFRASRKRTKPKDGDNVNIVSLKAKSTSELSSQQIEEDDDDDDEAGFKAPHKKLVPTRSISEDSIFKPDPKDSKKSNIEPFTKGAKSVENINQNFKSELANKLKKRQSFHSDDDGLPNSPVSSFTTADIIMGGGLKGAPGKSTSRESEKSLISVDGSENEEEDLFQTNWRASVASVVTRKKPASQTESSMDLDLSAVQPTVALRSDAAKHRISVAPPARRGPRQGKKAPHQKVSNASALPRLSEESPTKVRTEENVFELDLSPPPVDKEVVLETSPVVVKAEQEEKKPVEKPIPTKPTMAQSTPIPIPGAGKVPVSRTASGGQSEEETSKGANSPASPVSKSASTEERSKPEMPEKQPESTPQKSSTKGSELSQVFNRLKKTPVKTVEDLSQDSDKENMSEELAVKKPSLTEMESKALTKTNETQGSPQIIDSEKSQGVVLRKTKTISENVKPDTKPGNVSTVMNSMSSSSDKPSVLVVKEPLRPTLSAPVQNSPVNKAPVSINTAESSSPPTDVSVKFKTVEPESKTEEKDSVKISVGGGLQRLASPKEDYKLKRQGRSKTLPEQPLAKEIVIDKSATLAQRNDYDNVTFVTNKPQITEGSSGETGPPSLASSAPSRPVSTVITTAAKRPEPKRLSLKGGIDSSEPIWVVMARKKQTEREEKDSSTTKDEKAAADVSTKTTEPTSVGETGKTSPVTGRVASFKISRPENSVPTKSPSQVMETKKSSPITGRVASFKISKPVTSVPTKTPPSQISETQKSSLVSGGGASKISKPESTLLSKSPPSQIKAASITSISIPDTKTAPKVAVSDTKHPSKVPLTDSKPVIKTSSQETKPPVKSAVHDNKNSSNTTDTKSVLVSKPPVTFVRNSQDSKVTTPVVPANKPSLGKSFTIEKPTKPAVKSFTIEKPASAGLVKGNASTPGRSFTIDKTSTGNTVHPSVNTSVVKTVPAEKTEKKEESKSANIPAWRSNLQKKKDCGTTENKAPEMKKIEIIEKSETGNTQQKPPQLKSPEKKVDEKPPVILREKTKAEKCSGVASSRASTVLDLVKNYQKLQVS